MDYEDYQYFGDYREDYVPKSLLSTRQINDLQVPYYIYSL